MLGVIMIGGCRKDAEINSYFGEYTFIVKDSGEQEINSDGTWGSWDTVYVKDGSIIPYSTEMGSLDEYKVDDDLEESRANKITVLMENKVLVNAQVSENSVLVTKETNNNPSFYFHYHHSGQFYGTDSIVLNYNLEHPWKRRFIKIRGSKK